VRIGWVERVRGKVRKCRTFARCTFSLRISSIFIISAVLSVSVCA
jgi:hypothetical protein